MRIFSLILVLACSAECVLAADKPLFVEAETFVPSSAGWVVATGPETRQASGVATLHGAGGPKDATASKTVTLKDAGHYRIWVRFRAHPTERGPFTVAALSQGREAGSQVFDAEVDLAVANKKVRRGAYDYVWESMEVDLPAGDVVLRLAKHEQKNCSGLTRHVDCLLLTTDPKLVPNHTAFGQQTYLRVTFGDGYERPVYLHVFADHYRAPWYQHLSIGKSGLESGVSPRKGGLVKSGDRIDWINISSILYQDSGALLNFSARYAYTEPAARLRATLDFATAPEEQAIVRTIQADCQPNGLVVVVPPDLATPEHRAQLRTDRDFAEETGKLADAFDWPTFGRPPAQFPFLVRESLAGGHATVDAAVKAREQETLDYIGFARLKQRPIHGEIWFARDKSFCSPEIDAMKARAAAEAATFKQSGRSSKDILFCQLMDEPTGKPASVIANDPASIESFRAWLKKLDKTPADLLVADWDAVRPVQETHAAEFPALHYYTQRFRTRQLGDFMAAQRQILERAYGGSFPILANLSDGAIYNGNFYAQGVDYFELLDADDGQNAVWGEDWANGASTYQCAAFNIELMRAATRRHGQVIGQYLIAYAGRKPWDVKLKAVGELARGVKMMESFYYGPVWSSHEGGPAARSTVWAANPAMWAAHAELAREIGAAEDLLLPAMPAPAEVAVLYSSASDVWTMKSNLAYGFDRMHTWLALTHAQVPSDIVHESQVAAGQLANYKVCYLAGPNLTGAAATKLAEWVRNGGTLWITAGAAARDEYDRPLTVLDELLPANRSAAVDAQPFKGSGRVLHTLRSLDEVTADGGAELEVLSVRQHLDPRLEAQVLGRYKDGSAALVKGAAGKGTVYAAGFLPSLAYVKTAEVARLELSQPTGAPAKGAAVKDKAAKPDQTPKADASDAAAAEAELNAAAAVDAKADDRLARSANPWAFPAGVRELMLRPVRSAGVEPPVLCDVPLVDAVSMTSDRGVLLPLANYTLRPLDRVTLAIRASRKVTRVESSKHGPLKFKLREDGRVEVTLPLEATDFIAMYFDQRDEGR